MAVEVKTGETKLPAEKQLSMPILGMCSMSLATGFVVALSMMVIRVWPQPVSVAPYFGGRVGLIWGLVVGALFGLILGYLVDDAHFHEDVDY
jgi:hypothetical protein